MAPLNLELISIRMIRMRPTTRIVAHLLADLKP